MNPTVHDTTYFLRRQSTIVDLGKSIMGFFNRVSSYLPRIIALVSTAIRALEFVRESLAHLDAQCSAYSRMSKI